MEYDKVANLKPNANASICGTIASKAAPRQINTSRGPSQVTEYSVSDGTGTIKFSTFGTQAQAFEVGAKIKIVDGWVSEYRGQIQIGLGRSGMAGLA